MTKKRKGFQKSPPVVNGALPARTARQGGRPPVGARDALNAKRRRLPMVRIETDYVSPNGPL